MKRRPGKSIQELDTCICQAAATCDFSSITNPLDEALQTCFICSINNEAVLKALFKINVDELMFTGATEVATETKDVVKVAKKTVFGLIPKHVEKVFRKLIRKLPLFHLLRKIKANDIVVEKPVIWHPIVISRTLLAITVNFKVI